MGCAHCDRTFSIARVVDAVRQTEAGHAHTRGNLAIAGVARRGHDDDSRLYEPIDFGTQRTLTAREHFRVEFITEAQIDAVDTNHLRIRVHDFADVRERTNHIA